MALDKHGILSELGSVMNKLQSADCGCMGKLFSNNPNAGPGGQMGSIGSPLPTCGGCRRGCCHGHGFGAGAAFTGQSCMGRCNPPKLYADTYSYLSNNLMQPVVQEVYDDLKSLTPGNTIMNNPALANKMGLAQGEAMQGGAPMQGGNAPPNQMQGMCNPMQGMGNPMQGMGNPMQEMHNGVQDQMGSHKMNSQQMGGQQMIGYQMVDQQMGGQPTLGGQPMSGQPMDYQQIGNQQMTGQPMGGQQMMNQQSNSPQVARMMGGMGPDIMKMMATGLGGTCTSPAAAGGGQATPGGGMPSQPGQEAQMNQGQFKPNRLMPMPVQQQMQNPTTQYVTGQDTNPYAQMPAQNSLLQGNVANTYAQMPIQNNMQQGNANAGAGYQTTTIPTTQQMAPSNRGYGQHSLGMSKFHEMFPGVMNGNLGFDPMAIALGMNPANEKNMAVEKMKSMMMGKGQIRGSDTAAPAATNQQGAVPQQMTNQQGVPSMQTINQQGIPTSQIVNQQGISLSQAQNQQGGINNAPPLGVVPQQQMYTGQVPQQQVYTAVTGSPSMVQQPPQRLQGQQQYQANQQQPPAGDPNAAADGNQLQQQQNEGYVDPQSAPNQQFIKEPIFPADTSRNLSPPNRQIKNQNYYTQYNTLGQPVEMLPAHLYQPPPVDPNEPRTLYGSRSKTDTRLRNDHLKYSVKSTVSKTALMGSRPAGNTPSRSQLQQVYHQYKGSHSNTHQHIRAPQGGTHSDRRINVQENVAPPQKVPVDKVGDTTANNQIVNEIPTKGQPMSQMGDVPASTNKSHGDVVPALESPMKQTRLRNGLQDMIYTTYPSGAAWSFHGHDNNSPPAYRMRNRGY